MKENQNNGNRRDFLKLAGMGTVMGGVALAVNDSAEAGEIADASSNGYRETSHVKTYYESVKF